MEKEKCFCHICDSEGNKYIVKDKEARERLTYIEQSEIPGINQWIANIEQVASPLYRYRLMFYADKLTECMGNGDFKIINITCEFYSRNLMDINIVNGSSYVPLTKVEEFLSTLNRTNLQCTGLALQLDSEGVPTNTMLMPITLGISKSTYDGVTKMFNFSCIRIVHQDNGLITNSNMALRFYLDNTQLNNGNGAYLECAEI